MSNIEKHSKIKKANLSGEFYFQSLIQEAYNQQELSDAEMENIQLQCIRLLAMRTESYTKGESSSVQIEAAQAIMESSLYTIGLYLKSLPTVSSALAAVKSDPVAELYALGNKILQSKINLAKHLFRLVCKTKILSDNYTYNATIDEGIKSFFTQYNADYGAYETSASIDYQLMAPVEGLAGVEYIIEYQSRLHMENLFCSRFDVSAIHEVLNGFNPGYKDLLINIFAQVLQNALGCMLVDKDIFSLEIVSSDLQKLKRVFTNKTKETICDLLLQKTNVILEILAIKGTALKSYCCAGMPELASRIYTATGSESLGAIFVPRHKTQNSAVLYSMGNKMDDAEYRIILNEILSCKRSDDKIQIIKENFKSLADMEDVLQDGEFTEAETFAILGLLEDIEIAALISRYPQFLQPDETDDSEGGFLSHFKCYLQNISAEKLKELREAALGIVIE